MVLRKAHFRSPTHLTPLPPLPLSFSEDRFPKKKKIKQKTKEELQKRIDFPAPLDLNVLVIHLIDKSYTIAYRRFHTRKGIIRIAILRPEIIKILNPALKRNKHARSTRGPCAGRWK